MNYRFLGKSGLCVSELCFGVMTFGGSSWWKVIGDLDQSEANEMVGIALDAGINFFDTADGYSEGLSEVFLGKALGKRRQEVVISTKVYLGMGPGQNRGGLSRRHIIEACDASLRRLGTDFIDLYHVHSYDRFVPQEETLRALDDLVRQGKVRYIACSNYSGWQLIKALALSESHGWEKFIAYQGLYTLLCREIEYELVPVCLQEGLGILTWSPLAGGFLTGKYRRAGVKPQGARHSGEYAFYVDEEKGFTIVEALEEISNRNNASIAQAALNYLLQKPGVCSVIIGARNKEQLVDNIRTAGWKMANEDVARLDELSQPRPLYPYWHQEFTETLR